MTDNAVMFFKLTSSNPEFQQNRLNICFDCDSFLKIKYIPSSSICKQCGCIVLLKTSIKKQRCPRGFWDKEIEKEKNV